MLCAHTPHFQYVPTKCLPNFTRAVQQLSGGASGELISEADGNHCISKRNWQPKKKRVNKYEAVYIYINMLVYIHFVRS